MLTTFFDAQTTRKLSIALMTSGGAFLFAALNLVGSGVSGGNLDYASKVSQSIFPLFQTILFGFIGFASVQIADHPKTPQLGRFHSKINHLQTGGAIIVVLGIPSLAYGAIRLLVAAYVPTA